MKIKTPTLSLIAWLLAGCATTAPTPEPGKQASAEQSQEQELVFPAPPDPARFVYERTILGSTDVTTNDKSARWRQALTGETDAGVGLAKPFDVSACKGRVFVSDTVRRSVMVFDVTTHKFYEIGKADPGSLRKPLGIDTDAACHLYVADATMRKIMVYEADGTFLRSLGGVDSFERLTHVAVDAEGTEVFAVDTGGVKNDAHRVRVFDAVNGEHKRDIGTRGAGDGQFNLPRDVDFRDGLLYVVDGGNFRVSVLKRDGSFVRNIGSLGRRYGQFARPKGLAVDGAGNIYVSDTAHGNFQIFDAEGHLLLFVGTRAEKLNRATYMLPAGIAIDEDGRVFMVDQYFRKVDVFRPVDIKESDGYLGNW